MKPIKACIIGTGFVGLAHIEAVRRLGFVEVVALVEPESWAFPAGTRTMRRCSRTGRFKWSTTVRPIICIFPLTGK
jgi:cation diffusion facilitator CzcD-associated flavoprotein CzcO